MSRPLRIEFPGALYHLTSRGDRREAIFVDDTDRAQFLNVLAQALERFHGEALAYCLMGNHYHLVLRTRQANLAALMRQLNGVYTQAFNRRHGLVGHLFQGRYKAILVDSERYLLTLCAYVELNPVRACMVTRAEDWSWSSYRAHIGLAEAPPWLDVESMAKFLAQREELSDAADWREAQACYAELVTRGMAGAESAIWTNDLRQQIYLGDADFVERMQARALAATTEPRSIPKPQRSRPRSLSQWLAQLPTREAALRAAHVESGISMSDLAKELGLSVGRVSQLIKRAERARSGSWGGGSD